MKKKDIQDIRPDVEKVIQAISYIAKSRDVNFSQGTTVDDVMILLFFADKWHLNKYGRTISNGTHVPSAECGIAMPYILLMFMFPSDEGICGNFENYVSIESSSSDVYSVDVQMDLLSDSDIEILENTIDLYQGIDTEELIELTKENCIKNKYELLIPIEYSEMIAVDSPGYAHFKAVNGNGDT